MSAFITGTVLSWPGAGEFLAEVARRDGEVRLELTVVLVPVAGRRRDGDGSLDTRVDRALLILEDVTGARLARLPGDPDLLTGCEYPIFDLEDLPGELARDPPRDGARDSATFPRIRFCCEVVSDRKSSAASVGKWPWSPCQARRAH